MTVQLREVNCYYPLGLGCYEEAPYVPDKFNFDQKHQLTVTKNLNFNIRNNFTNF